MKKKTKNLAVFPILVLLLGAVFTSGMFYHTYQQIAFEHISAFSEVMLEHIPEAEPQLLSALKEYHLLTEQEVAGNHYLSRYGYRADEFCKGFPAHTFLFPLLLFLVVAGAFVSGNSIFRRRYQKRIADLTRYLEQVNTGLAEHSCRHRKMIFLNCRMKYIKPSRHSGRPEKRPLPQRKILPKIWQISHTS